MDTILESKVTKNQIKLVNTLVLLKEIFMKSITDEQLDDKTDNEEADITYMSELESEQSAEQRRKRKGEGLKILTQNQMISRLPISLVQLKAGNSSEKKLKNEIRQLLHSLYRSKKLTKTMYNNLINTT